ncbi:MAG: nucleoside hydrolase [Candidatus Hydrogenedentes bacterium]|nr:nucleoside hydrolase [Candidatus Hydrogenedentota bacterium]
MAAARIPVIFDTDIGDDIDDLYALYLALFHPRLELIAVTTVHGDTQRKARLAAKALRLAGRSEIPIGAGIEMSESRIKRHQRNPFPQDHATYHVYVKPSDPENSRTYPKAIDVIRAAFAKATAPVAIVGEGALSNVAQFIQCASAGEKSKIKCISLMGGETGRVMSEFNILCDPEAADVVLNSGLPVFMGTFDLTSQLYLTMEQVESHFGGSKSGPLQVIYECTKLWEPRKGPKPGPVLYDLAPVFWLAEPARIKTRPSTVRVELEGTYTRGQTVRVAEEGPVLESMDLDPQALVRDFVQIIQNGAKNGD